MFEDLNERTLINFKNPLMLAATFMDPRYRNLRFIKDSNQRDMAKFIAQGFIKNSYRTIFRFDFDNLKIN